VRRGKEYKPAGLYYPKNKYVKMLEEHNESAYNVCAVEKFSIHLQALPKAEEVNL
jgi:hypothetical protein